MLPRRTPRRRRKAYEREWRGFFVDANLEDSWLERLNNLAAFDPISICEGHSNREAESHSTAPHIKLRLKDLLLPGVGERWERHKTAIISTASDLFQTGDTDLNMEMRFRLRSGTGRLHYQETLVVRVYRRDARATKEMDEGTRRWFEQSVEQIEELDRVFASLSQGSPGNSEHD